MDAWWSAVILGLSWLGKCGHILYSRYVSFLPVFIFGCLACNVLEATEASALFVVTRCRVGTLLPSLAASDVLDFTAAWKALGTVVDSDLGIVRACHVSVALVCQVAK